ncbi:hypothetical protein [Lactiplantibacillus plantarum]|uniref:hypothetical protein n=1 Tax=Lactiplantibacillus plantarum TaxID=1590 RepID=UPI000FECCC1F|nr:hypothetical protein [Lactiplantibacillus plantarum]QAR37627.1 hypothetical protein EQJ27_06585 [Lactiplantibacillus plantarum]RWZ07802.1 hypothetical protein EQG51_06585 [Lactiplantibacillus plantarum]RWZ35642.1 hypothetical protein EQG59_06585 [Lactiplantibacillus plantarum]
MFRSVVVSRPNQKAYVEAELFGQTQLVVSDYGTASTLNDSGHHNGLVKAEL